MIFEYQVGMRVKLREDRNYKGTVTDAEDPNEIMVQWDKNKTHVSRAADNEPVYEDARFLMPDDPTLEMAFAESAKAIQAKIDEATHSLEATFAALRAAHKMETGYECDGGFHGLMDNPLLDMSEFEKVVTNNGWSTSSIYC